MPININVKITPFGQLTLVIGQPAYPIEEHLIAPAQEELRYQEPQETASRIYEVEYREELKNYVIPSSTG
ncbi:MAG: hypothetical protein ACE5OR_01610 [bacterium]